MNLPPGTHRGAGSSLGSILAVLLCIFFSQLAFGQTTDLAIQGLGLSVSSLVAGDTVAASATMANVGTTTIPQYSAAGFYLSANATLEAWDVLLGTDTLFTTLAPGSTQAVTADLIIPAGTQAGSYYLLFAADYGHAFAESNEANNLGAVPITVLAASTVDLYFRLSSSPISLVAGAKVAYKGNIGCQGSGTASSVYLGSYLSKDKNVDASDILMGAAGPVEALAAGTNQDITGTFTVPIDAPPGPYWVLHQVDHAGLVAEFNEDNNISAIAVTVTAPAYDLTFAGLAGVTPNVTTAGSDISAAALVMNGGNSPTQVMLDYYLSADQKLDTLGPAPDVWLGSYQSPTDLDGGNASTSTTKTLTIPDTIASGHYYVIFRLDANHFIAETDETNNLHAVAISVDASPLPDLAFSPGFPIVKETTLAAGASIDFLVNVGNIGTAHSLGYALGYFLSADSTFDASDRLLSNLNFSWTPAGSASGTGGTSLRVPEGTALGKYYLLFASDYHGKIAEIDETNNVSAVAITVAETTQPPGIPDLYIGKYSVSSSLTAPGDTVVASFTFGNIGNATAPPTSVNYYFSSSFHLDLNSATFLGQVMADSMASGKELTFSNVKLVVPDGLAPGNYYFHLKADPTESIAEASETNNSRPLFFTITRPGTDLMIWAMNTGSASPAGATRNISVSIANQGPTPAASSKINVYLSENNTLEPADVFLGSSPDEGLAGNQKAEKQIAITIPPGTAPGNYHIIALIDQDNTIVETQENNNVAASVPLFTVGEADLAIAAGAPAFLLDVTTNTPVPAGPVSVEPGHRLETSIIISNPGKTIASTNNAVHAYFSADSVHNAGDIMLYGNSVASLRPATDQSFQYPIITIPTTLASGAYYILFMVDPLDRIGETDETNNMVILPIQVTGAPVADLALDSAAASPAAAQAGDTLTLAATLANTGTAPAPASTLRYYLSTDTALDSADVVLGSAAAAALAAADILTATAELTLPANTAMGRYHILFVADADSTLTEENELNNLASVPFQVGVAGKDLTVRSHSTTPDSLVAGSATPVWAKIFNQGVEAAASSKMGIYLSADQTLDGSDRLIGSGTGDSLAALTETTRHFGFTIPPKTAAGNYYLIYKVDPANEVAESNEDNNTRTVALFVTAPPLPDVTITTAAPVAAAPTLPGATVATAITLKNQGSAPLSADTISFYLSANDTYEAADVHVGSSAVPALAAGAETQLSVTLAIPAETAPGAYHLLALADQAGSISESDETNNVYAFAFSVAAPAPDLTLQSPALSAATIARGAALSASATLANVGTGPALAGKLQYYLSANDSFESSDVLLGETPAEALAAGDSSALSASLTIPATTATGDYYVLLVADATGLNAESNEANNTASVALTVSVASGIKDLQAGFAVRIAPNPAPEQVTITADNLPRGVKIAELTLHDITGFQVMRASSPLQGNALQTKLAIGHLSQGTYLLHIRLGDEVTIRKIVITR